MNDIVETKPDSQNTVILAKKSWVAWIGWALLAVFMFLLIVPALWQRAAGTALLVMSLLMAGVVYQIAVARSYVLYMDDQGVWVQRGILPWSQGVVGVKWRDLDGALYLTGFVSWATNSYTVHLAHRFTKASEIHVTAMYAGKQAVEAINKAHADMIRRAG